MSLEFEESLASSGSVLDHWPVPDRDIPQFPSLANDGTIEINSYLLAFLKLDGVGWNDYQVQREQSGLSVEDSRLRTYRKMFERIGIIYPKSGIIRLAALGLSIQELKQLKGAELKASFSALKYQAVDILSRYQLINPAEIENRKLPLSCDVLPYVCLWKVMSYLEGKLHIEELNRIVLRIMNMGEISSYVARIIRAREQADNYEKLNETELRKLLGIPVMTDQPSARLASLFSLAGWGGLLIERAARRDGFRHFTEDGSTLVKKYVDDPPKFFESPDVDSWFKHYSAWARSQSVIDGYITQFQRQCLSAYKEQPILVKEHYRIERSAAQGGYGRRQLYELIQNGADALINYSRGQIQVLLTNSSLYCANEGQPFTLEGVDSILTSHISRKRGLEIGRFGLGFKSVLGVTSTPKLFSRSGSFVFDAARSENVIKQVIPNAANYPTLRIAFVMDPEESGRSDSALSKFMTWADTIVELPRNLPESEWLSMDMPEFPAQFLLFCPHVNRLILENRTNNTLRDIRVSSKERNIVSLDDGDNSILWKVFQKQHRLSPRARENGGELYNTETIPISWAVPLKGKINAETKSPGQFWAFFPTNNATKLTGILNAPWKTNEDRQNLLSCTLNYELIEAFADLVADSIQSLVLDLKDPCDYLEFLPGRLDEFMNWADNELNKKVYEAVALKPSLPDMNGNLVKPTEVKLHPANVPYEALDIWKTCAGRPNNWCHHNVESPTRRSRAERLLEQCKCDVASVSEWLEALSAKATPETSLGAIKAASKILLKGPTYYKSQILNSKIILDNSNQLVKPIPGSIFIAVDPTSHESGLRCVHPAISSNKEGRDALATLGITEIDASSELQAFLLNRNLTNMKEEDWPRFWQIIDRIDPSSALATIKKWIGTGFAGNLRVRTRIGGFMPINETLLPGPIVPEDNHRDAKVIIDLNFHKNHKFILTELGAVDVPRANQGSIMERWFDRFIQNARNRYMKNLQTGGSSPRQDLLEFTERVTVGPLLPLLHLSDEGKAILTRYVLEASEKEQPWILKHSSNQKYRTMQFEPPSLWMVRIEGRLNSSLGFKRVSDCVSPSLGQWSRVFAVADCTENQALRLGLPPSLHNIQKQQWEQAFIEASKLDDLGYLGNFYASACSIVPNPEFIRCIKGNKFTLCAPGAVIVTHDSSLQKSLNDTGEAYLLVENSDKADSLVKNWKLLSPAIRGITKSIRSSPSGPDKPITDRFLGLSSKLSEQQAAYRLIPCSMLRQEVTTATGIVGTDTIFSLSGDTIYFSDKLGNSELLDRLTSALNIPLTSEERNEILQNRAVTEQRERAHRIRIKEKLNEKLLEAVGAKAVRQKLPKGLVNAAIGKFKDFKTNDLLAAELVMAVYGVETLKMFKEELTAVGLEPPHQWAGGNSTRRFVKNLGFPEEYAGFPEAERAEVLEVDGPPELPDLHDFQETIVSRIRMTIKEQKRGLLSLPTGAGKTRVTVESIIRAYKEEGIPKLILWVAQSDELCEQAVQTWSEVWRGLGPKESLHINRLWASNEADYYTEGPQVVVATIDKLQGCLNDLNYDWLSNPQCVVIDEAHGATTPEYTRLLEWLGLERGKESRSLLGLTATPFRGGFHGGGEEETKALVNRFSAKRLDQKVLSDDPYAELQSKGVLAHVEHKLLEGSVIKDLTKEELSHLAQFGRLPPAAADRLGSDASRNEILLGSIKELDKDWPILLFATSVDHASTMAAMLNSEGILAAAISGETDPGARRYYVEKFRRGGIRVLTNFGVLTAGFDAPAIRAVYVARPVFSPGLYQQMIGRGLRGPLNGGKERCLIVNVNDNFMQYGEKLAFTKFEYLWNS